MVFELVKRVAEGDASAQRALLEELEGGMSPNLVLINAAVRYAGSESVRALCDEHLWDFRRAQAMHLHEQEFPTLFPVDVKFEESMHSILGTLDWGPAHVRRLALGGHRTAVAARMLLDDMDLVAADAARFAEVFSRMWKMLGQHGLHVLQLQALFRAQEAIGTLKGRAILEVGSHDSALAAYLRSLGADVTAIDLNPPPGAEHTLVGDFMTHQFPRRYDAVVATAVFEFGSGWNHFPDRSHPGEVPLLHRLADVLNPGGVAIIENLALPVPFTAADADRADFQVLDVRVPRNDVVGGGRGCAIRLRDRPATVAPAPSNNVPVELARVLESDAEAAAEWHRFSPGHRDEYATYVGHPRQPEARARRAERTRELLVAWSQDRRTVPVARAVPAAGRKPAARTPSKPAAKKPVAKKPVAKKPVAKKPAAKKPAPKKAAAKKPAAKKAAPRKAAGKKGRR